MRRAAVGAYELHVEGLVQGVGFRPFVYRIAQEYGLKGYVSNRNDGVLIHAEGPGEMVNRFQQALAERAPVAAVVRKIVRSRVAPKPFPGFTIRQSMRRSEAITEISPDIAVCSDCLQDMKTQAHRLDYPFINCTNCGPRFTILRELPYDRAKTSMAPYTMCSHCEAEYKDVSDRRFHAQPLACNTCGPQYLLDGKKMPSGMLTDQLATLIQEGKVLAMKGMGGFNLLCDALNPDAVSEIRKVKKRDSKPFALMCSDLAAAKKYAVLNTAEEECLTSCSRPIVILKARNSDFLHITDGIPTVGLLLPYLPVQYALFSKLKTDVLVFTSGNLTDHPIWINAAMAKEQLSEAGLKLPLVDHQREIVNRADDSVVQVVDQQIQILRRSRGYVPSSIALPISAEGVLAVGAELSHTFCVGKGKKALLSQHIGDLKNQESLDFFTEAYERFRKLFRFTPELLACDLHPDYTSTRFARQLGLPLLEVQHHHAHISSCMAEHGLLEPVVGVSLDGTGYGTDKTVWGGEFLWSNGAFFERLAHLEPVEMPGGDSLSTHPWKSALAYVLKYAPDYLQSGMPAFMEEQDLLLALEVLQRKINTHLSSSCGRLFDAVASLLNVCQHNAWQARAPVKLENLLDESVPGTYDWETKEQTLSFGPMIRGMLREYAEGKDRAIISTKFHRTLVEAFGEKALQCCRQTGLQKVVLSGGCFQNRFLLSKLKQYLTKQHIQVYTPQAAPANDGGIALGQLYTATLRRRSHVS